MTGTPNLWPQMARETIFMTRKKKFDFKKPKTNA